MYSSNQLPSCRLPREGVGQAMFIGVGEAMFIEGVGAAMFMRHLATSGKNTCNTTY